jgi:hypothetical protein
MQTALFIIGSGFILNGAIKNSGSDFCFGSVLVLIAGLCF